MLNNRYVISIWQLIIIIVTSVLVIDVPFEFLFSLVPAKSVELFSPLVSLLFLLDVFYTIYFEKASSKPHLEEKNVYLKFIIWFDLIAVIPYPLIFSNGLFKLLILSKLVKVAYYMHEWKEKEIKYSDIISLLFFVYWAGMITHGLSVLWLWLRGIDSSQSDLTNYINALYWIITTLTTIGYGDITPVGKVQRLFTIFVEILEVGFYGYIIGNIAALLSKKDPARMQYLDNIERLSTLAKFRKIPKPLQKKLRDYYEYIWKKRMGYDETDFLENLPPGLKTEVSLTLKKDVINKIILFSDAQKEFKNLVAMYLKPLVLTPGDILFRAGDLGTEMYFVINGKLEILAKETGAVLTELGEGDYFGEMALFRNQPRTATVRAISYCDLYYLNKSTFDKILTRHPAIKNKILEKIKTLEAEGRV